MTWTTMRSAVPPSASEVMPVNDCMAIGRTAMRPKKSAPTKVMRVMTLPRYASVLGPGRTPGTKAPFFCRFSAIMCGSKVTIV